MRRVDEYIEMLPDDRRELCAEIRELIHALVPGIDERLSFKIPFYHYFGMFMFLNNTKDGIDVVFCRGKDLLELFPQLQHKDRAIMASVNIATRRDIADKQLSEIILTASNWNEEAKRLKIPILKNPGKKYGVNKAKKSSNSRSAT